VIRRPASIVFVLSVAALALVLVPASGLAAKGGNGSAQGGGGGGKPGGGGGGSIALVMVEDANGNGSPNWSDTVSFNVSTSATSAPELKLTCYQNGEPAYWTQTAYYEGYPFPWTQLMELESGLWTGGAAECTAVLYYSGGRRTTTLATLSFHVDA
jgi:hypothetical protein